MIDEAPITDGDKPLFSARAEEYDGGDEGAAVSLLIRPAGLYFLSVWFHFLFHPMSSVSQSSR